MDSHRLPFVAMLLIAWVCLSACGRKDKVIPRDTMVDIYADLFVADQWLKEQGADFMAADTVRFYEPIFQKYGYTTLDFRNSANYYLQDSRRFARILQRVSSRLEDHAKYLDRLSSDISSIQSEIDRLKRSATLPAVFYDSAFFARSAGFEIELQADERGAWMPVFPSEAPDSVSVADTLAVSDSLRTRDSLHMVAPLSVRGVPLDEAQKVR